MRRCAARPRRTWPRARASSWTAPISGPASGNWCGNWPGSTGPQLLFVYCECPPAEARRRLGLRLTDPQAISDGRVELFEAQAQDFDPVSPEDRPLLRLDTNREVGVVLEELQNFSCKVIYEGACGRRHPGTARVARHPSRRKK